MTAPDKVRREAGVIGLLYASLGSIIGSGWLFGALNASMQAGPFSMASWTIGATAVLFLAFVFAELSTMFPNSGALVHMVHVSHGDMLGKIWSWVLFLAFVSVPPVEVIAVLTYMNTLLPQSGFLGMGHFLDASGLLTPIGTASSLVLLALVVALNFMAIRWVIAINSVTTWWKVLVPVVTIFILMAYSFHPENMTAQLQSTPTSGIFTAVGTAGIIFSFLGFQQAIALAGETRNPGKYVPIALIGSVVIALIIYLGLQYAFIVALDPNDISSGWPQLHFAGMFGPLAAILTAVGALWWASVLYFDAVVSPLGTAFIYITGSPRILMAAGEMGGAPSHVAKLNRWGVPWIALIATYIFGAAFFFPFPSWSKLVSAVSSITVLSYAIGPVILLHLRKILPGAERPFRLKGSAAVSMIAFIASNWIIYWTGNYVMSVLFVLVGGYVAFLLVWHLLVKRLPASSLGWQHAWWLLPYFAGMWLISFFGPSASGMGGNDTFGFFTGMLLVTLFSPAMLWLALKTGVTSAAAQAHSDKVGAMGSRGMEMPLH
ncbi:MAG TPA: APC family permease [Gammaproteobacteria bacterium]|jgi:amino acid transporter|nr:APC family permease [Gammaproteobacteria bacterium]